MLASEWYTVGRTPVSVSWWCSKNQAECVKQCSFSTEQAVLQWWSSVWTKLSDQHHRCLVWISRDGSPRTDHCPDQEMRWLFENRLSDTRWPSPHICHAVSICRTKPCTPLACIANGSASLVRNDRSSIRSNSPLSTSKQGQTQDTASGWPPMNHSCS